MGPLALCGLRHSAFTGLPPGRKAVTAVRTAFRKPRRPCAHPPWRFNGVITAKGTETSMYIEKRYQETRVEVMRAYGFLRLVEGIAE